MLGHDPNNMGAIVTRNRPNQNNSTMGFGDDLGLDDFSDERKPKSGMSRNNGQMRTQTRTRTSGGGMGGRRRTSGGGGGGY